jgi:hypothetical protein
LSRNGKNGHPKPSGDEGKPERGIRKRLPRVHDRDQPKHEFPPQQSAVPAGDARVDNWKTYAQTKAQRRGPNGRRQPANIDPMYVAELAFLGMKKTEVGVLCGVDEAVITRRFEFEFRAGKAAREHALREAQMQKALGGDTSMLIFLGKNELGQADKTQHDHTGLIEHEHRAIIERMMTNPAANAAAELHARKQIQSHVIEQTPADEIEPGDDEGGSDNAN